jgi:hypothetical protein
VRDGNIEKYEGKEGVKDEVMHSEWRWDERRGKGREGGMKWK